MNRELIFEREKHVFQLINVGLSKRVVVCVEQKQLLKFIFKSYQLTIVSSEPKGASLNTKANGFVHKPINGTIF